MSCTIGGNLTVTFFGLYDQLPYKTYMTSLTVSTKEGPLKFKMVPTDTKQGITMTPN